MNHRKHLVAAAAIAGCGLTLAACGGFDSAASGQNLIHDYVKKYGGNRVSVKTVKCPSGVKQQTGGSYDCQVTLHLNGTATDSSGTITIHMISGNKVEIFGKQDLHLH